MSRESLAIRRMAPGDLENLFRLLSDPRVMKFLEPPFSREKAREFLEKAGLSEPPLIWAVENPQGEFVGYVILHSFEKKGVELGWVLLPEHWGKGYATALTGQLLEKAREMGEYAVIEAAPGQTATRKIALSHGFREAGREDGLLIFRKDLACSPNEDRP